MGFFESCGLVTIPSPSPGTLPWGEGESVSRFWKFLDFCTLSNLEVVLPRSDDTPERRLTAELRLARTLAPPAEGWSTVFRNVEFISGA